MKWPLALALVMLPALTARAAQDSPQPVATTKQVMLDIIHPAFNALLLVVNRGGPATDKEWAEARRAALIVAESGNLLLLRNRAPVWAADARVLVDAGAAAYKSVEAKDVKALAASSERIDAACTTCHKHSRPTVFPSSK